MTSICLPPPVPLPVARTLDEYPPFLQQLLVNRGITTTTAAEQYITPSYDDHLHDPFLLHDMSEAVERVHAAIAAGETIVIFSDYDCDGIPGAVVLHDFFTAVSHEAFRVVIPHRHYDGFGLSVTAVEHMVETGPPDLIITIDCGTTSVAAVARARAAGIDVIITDHHEPGEQLPDAVAVVNPKVGDTYPFSGLCGAAVVYKLIQALLATGKYPLPPGQEKWWLDMVGVATIADMVPLQDENRVLAHYGLTVLRKSRRPGLQQLLRKQRVNQQQLTEDDIGFTIGPRINAASRMDTPEEAFRMLATKDVAEAGDRVAHLEQLNNERKVAVAQMTKDLHRRVEVVTELPPVLVFGNPEWRPSLVGLAANKLAEEHGRPVFLWGRDGNESFKGSCRSGGSVSVVHLMEAVAHVFTEYGGHHMSGGFTVHESHIHTFGSALIDAHDSLGTAAVVSSTHAIDAVLSLDEITSAMVALQRQCAPFGADNPKPLYLFEGVRPRTVDTFGKQQEHTKLTFTTSGVVREAIAFFRLPEQFTTRPEVDGSVSIVAHIEESYFMNRHQVRLRIVDIL